MLRIIVIAAGFFSEPFRPSQITSIFICLFPFLLKTIVTNGCKSISDISNATSIKPHVIGDMVNPKTSVKPNLYHVVMRVGTNTIMVRGNDFIIIKTILSTDYTHLCVEVEVVSAHFRFSVKDEIHCLVSFLVQENYTQKFRNGQELFLDFYEKKRGVFFRHLFRSELPSP